MQRFMFQMSLILALIFAGIWSTSPALAGKSDWADGKKGKNHKHEEKSEKYRDHRTPAHGKYDRRSAHGDHRREYFSEQKRTFIHGYYSDQFRHKHCPPGLIKKGKRCIPYGHAKKWSKGRRLPREVIFYDLPPSIVVQLGPPPPRHRFVRVAQDILLIAIGTGMVVDAFEDIGQQQDR
ncbi:MAG: RcnB family protein [Proteobacteria bacterium]|nr:RcnB family protein [Desulfobacula sp.]MBU4130986.1 RcnB family protein [Pseudomonadota bacterium]